MDKGEILQRILRGLQWENKPPKLKRSIPLEVEILKINRDSEEKHSIPAADIRS